MPAFSAQPVEKCTACSKTVYLTEKVVVEEKTDKKVFHKTCIRCQTCNKVLAIGQYSSMEGKFWCKPHFKQLFATKGNYDEAFGIEKNTKWDDKNVPATSTGPSSFVPEAKSEKAESKQTSEETLAKFRKYREEGESDKCCSCGKTVYLAEKMLVEDRKDKRLFHKTCFKCCVCGVIQDLRSYGSVDGKVYCKMHLKEVQGNAPATATTYSGSTPSSFIPATQEEKKGNTSQTPENIASKFRGAETEKCKLCSKSVYATEKVIIPEGTGKVNSIFHKNCLKCSVCKKALGVSDYGSANGVLFCTVHLKQYAKPEQAKGDGTFFVSPLAQTDNNYVAGPKDGDAPSTNDDEEDRRRDEDRDQDRDQDRERDQERDEDRDQDRDDDREREEREEREREEREREEREAEERRREESEREERARSSSVGRSSPALEKGRSSPGVDKNEDDESRKKEEERNRRREEQKRQKEEEERQRQQDEEDRERRRKERERRVADASNEDSGSSENRDRDAEREERRRKREEERKREDEERERQEEKRRKEREERKRQQEEESARELEEQERKAEERRRKLAELKANS